MINGAHTIIYSENAEADREFFQDVLKLPHVDAGEGWLIFGLPPSEVAVHPAEKNDRHELYLVRGHQRIRRRNEGPRSRLHRNLQPRLGPADPDHPAGRRQPRGLPADARAAVK